MATPMPPPAAPTLEEPTPVSYSLRARTVSDAMSGMSISRDQGSYSTFTQEELETHFARFKQYDLDNTGFISQANLKSVLEAIDMPEVSDEQCANMIAEVAMLTGHENDGKLSFRDYCALISYENKKRLQDEVAQAHEELRTSLIIEEEPEEEKEEKMPGFSPRNLIKSISGKLSGRKSTKEKVVGDAAAVALEEDLRKSMRDSQRDSMREEETEAGGDAPTPLPSDDSATEPAPTRLRGSSFAVLDQIAFSRIGAFEQSIQERAAKEQQDPRALYKKNAFDNKLAKFKAIESGEPRLGAEDIHKKTLKAKLHAFEQAAKTEPVAFKKTWKNVRQGAWNQKTTFAGGPAPKKSLADLP